MTKKWRKLYNRGIIEDTILMTAKGLENAFDGTTNVFGFRPDLTGFGTSVMLAAKQHRQDICKMVDRTCIQYNIGAREKFVIKLLASAIKRNVLNKSQQPHLDKYTSNMRALSDMQ